MSGQADIDDLRQRHQVLDGEIEAENTQVYPDDMKINALKKKKLKIKDLIQELETNG